MVLPHQRMRSKSETKDVLDTMGTEPRPDERDFDTSEVRRGQDARRCECEGERWTPVADTRRVSRRRDGTRGVKVVGVEDLSVVGRLVHVYGLSIVSNERQNRH